ncbi:hypothetical protein [Sphingomonas colocasiae]|uniref:Thioredoxin-like fold domain-containing protein n=1 Tax=Sphingomonas colocasiae TaxID=1848973 RepID=A0ABS7PRF9_9SPHN|nr:hypothetical protein [Sphingomonas colocasiae]MBY8823858.1 hypothetical protein [Sphingomonas colocasiae]
MNRREMLATSAALLVAGRVIPAAAQAAGHFRQNNGARVISGQTALHPLRVIDKITKASVGHGRPIYVLCSSRCPYSQALLKRHPGAVANLEIRYIPVTLKPEESGEVAQFYWEAELDKSAAFEYFKRYMALGYRGAPPANVVKSGSVKALKNSDELYSINLTRITHISRALTATYPEFRGFQTPAMLMPDGDSLIQFDGDHLPAISRYFS